MKSKITAVFDVKSQEYGQPYYSATNAVAIRNFQTACSDPQSMFSKYPEDFNLVLIGEFDSETGKIESSENLSILANASEFAKKNDSIES